MGRDIRVAAAIIVEGGRVLVAQRGYGEMAGKWEFPGGKIEPGEAAADACVREVCEELGATVGDLAPFMALEYGYPSFHMHLETFLCRLVEGVPTATEHTELRWLEPSELAGIDWLPADTAVVAALQEYLATGALPDAGATEGA